MFRLGLTKKVLEPDTFVETGLYQALFGSRKRETHSHMNSLEDKEWVEAIKTYENKTSVSRWVGRVISYGGLVGIMVKI